MQAVLTRGSLNLGVSWGSTRRGTAVLPALLLSLLLLAVSLMAAVGPPRLIEVIVRAQPGALLTSQNAVQRLGGVVLLELAIIDGFSARLPLSALPRLLGNPSTYSVTPDGTVELHGRADDYNPVRHAGSMYNLARSLGADFYWSRGITGRGVDVALIDSGVAPVDGLTAPGKVLNGPDLSFESQQPELRYIDTYGHGTHLAGIIAGRDDELANRSEAGQPERFLGVAPDARIVSIKVANRAGAADVSQVIAAIDWVVQQRNKNGLNIRVLNLSFGTDSLQPYQLDPLAYAAEVAWHKGIVVVAAAGNGHADRDGLNNPAHNPYLLAVGAADSKGTKRTNDDEILAWSSRGDGTRNPDLVAPGRSLVSLRVPGSFLDEAHPAARTAERYFRGSGTSQAAAAVAGAAALIIEQRPKIKPDELKQLLVQTARELPATSQRQQGAGMIDLKRAFNTATPRDEQVFERSSGLGSLDAARGSYHVVSPSGDTLEGEIDIFGNPWRPGEWAEASWAGSSWSGGEWNGHSWSGSSWSGHSWSGSSWSGHSWSGSSWSGHSWSGNSWSGSSWSGNSWSGSSWSGGFWSSPLWD